MPKITIDGQAYEFEGQHKLLQFALDAGVEIPYFCYHPAMSIPTNCRMCLVEVGFHMKDRATGEYQFDDEGNPVIQWGRKPATACNTPVSEGMFVKTHRSSEVIKTAQEGVLEYMLINHPLDCPICDQAGECPLQIWTYKYGPEGSRFENNKGHKQKRVELGPNVVLDQERCINCTRCTRFTEEISGTNQLTIIGRGDKNYPGCAPGEVFDDAYSMNTIDICPVGALTSKHHRFKARVWEMAYAPSIDMNDSTGTNINVWIRDNEVLRITPRKNTAINDYWMPDAHRLNVDRYNKDRVSGVKLRGGIPVNFEDGMERAGKLLAAHDGSVFFLGSAYSSFENNFALKEFAAQMGVTQIHYISHIEKGHGDGWLIQDDRTPNAAACELLGFKALTIEEMKAQLAGGQVSFLYALENDRLFGALASEDLAGITVIAHGVQRQPVYNEVDVLLPAANEIESDGVYINHKGMAQVVKMAVQIRQMSPEMWMRLPKSRLDKTGVAVDHWRNLDHINDVLPSWQLIAKVAAYMGKEMGVDSHQALFKVMKENFDVLKEVTITYKPDKTAFKHTQLEYAPRW